MRGNEEYVFKRENFDFHVCLITLLTSISRW